MLRFVTSTLLCSSVLTRVDCGGGGKAPRRFVVLTQPRSGSTWFVKYSELFAKMPGVVTRGEELHPDVVAKRTTKDLSLDIVEYLKYVRNVYAELECQQNKTRAVGFKLMYHQLPRSGVHGQPVIPGARSMLGKLTLESLLRYAGQQRVLHIHLIRINHLERFISMTAITTFGLRYHQKGGAPTSYSRHRHHQSDNNDTVIMVPKAEAFTFAWSQAKQNHDVVVYIKNTCAEFYTDCMTLYYEHLLGPDGDKLFAALRKRLNLPGPRPRRRRKPRKDPGDAAFIPCADRVSNWADIESDPLLGRTVWVAMCLSGNAIIPDDFRYGNFSIFVRPNLMKSIKEDQRSSRKNSHDAFRRMVSREKRKTKETPRFPPKEKATKAKLQ